MQLNIGKEMMMSESKTNRPTNEEERLALYEQLMRERYGDATRERYQIEENKQISK